MLIDGSPKLVSRTLKPIPNKYTQERYARFEFVGLDGELVVGNPTDKNLMQQCTSGLMSEDGEPDVMWHIFDKWDVDEAYAHRAQRAKSICFVYDEVLSWVPHKLIRSLEEMDAQEEAWVNEGYEGMMLRSPTGPYKQGRSTLREGHLLKIKRFQDDEAVIIGYVEQNRNDNEATLDERGYTKRSTHIAGKQAAGILGALQVRDCKTGVDFDVGTGFTAEQRKNLWDGRNYLIGQVITYKHFAVGVVDKPRFPVFKAFRDRRDM
jgi:DNA ligase-1